MRGSTAPLWLWVFAVVALGGFASLVFYLDYHQKTGNSPDLQEAIAGLSSKVGKGTDPGAVPRTVHNVKDNGKPGGKKLPNDGSGFDFYQLLPDLETVISDKELFAVKPKPDVAPPTPPAVTPQPPGTAKAPPIMASIKPPVAAPDGAGFYLQTGAFKDYQAADRMKASLALLGLQASIETVFVGGSGQWHRVRLGPFTSIGAMQQVRHQLQAGNVPSIMVRTKPQA